MVLSSKFGYNPYASGAGKTPGKAVAPSGVPICSTGIVAPGSHLSLSPQSPSFSLSALDHSSDVGLEDDHFTDVNEIVDSLSGLPPAALKEIGRIVRASKEPLTQPRPIIRTAVDPRAARLLQIEEAQTERPIKAKPVIGKRKAVVVVDDSSDDDDDEDDNWKNHGNTHVTLHIADEAEVIHFMKMRFTQIQQLATKVIAKAWIKAICPKKQANYPYVDSNPRNDQGQKRRRPKHEGKPRIPKFWPDVDLCRHKEPDHTRKGERTILLVHLLRLHWTEEEWVACNGDSCEVPQKIKNCDWVGFLRDAFPVNKLDEVQGSNPDKAVMRKRYLSQIYRVAEDEQMLKRRVGPPKQKRTYTAGAGWQARENTTVNPEIQSDRLDSEESSAPTTENLAISLSNSQSEHYASTPDSETRNNDSRSASLSSAVEIVREAKIEHMPFEGFVPMEEAPTHQASHDQDLKFDPMDESATVSLESVPPSCVSNADYYDSVWSGGMVNVQNPPSLYEQHQYNDTTAQWYAEAGQSQHQPAHVSTCTPTVASPNQAWSEYRHGYDAFETVTLPVKTTGQVAMCHNGGFEGVQQMAMSAPFVQPMVTAASDPQSLTYGVPGVQYVSGPFDANSGPEYMMTQHPTMYGRWP